jgi:hypothetical protein
MAATDKLNRSQKVTIFPNKQAEDCQTYRLTDFMNLLQSNIGK